MKKILLSVLFSYTGCMALWASDRIVKGYVLDKEGVPLPGAYVYDANKRTAVTGEDGYFELTVPEEVKELRADYVGFLTLTYDMERPDDIQILVMSPSTELKEVRSNGRRHRHRQRTAECAEYGECDCSCADPCGLLQSFGKL